MSEREYHGPDFAAEAIARLAEADRAFAWIVDPRLDEPFRTLAGVKLDEHEIPLYLEHLRATATQLIELAKLAATVGPTHKERNHLRGSLDPDTWINVLAKIDEVRRAFRRWH